MLAETSMVFPWNLGPLCLAQSGMMYHLLVLVSFWTCAPTEALSRHADSEQYLGHGLLYSLNFSQCASHDPHLHLLSEVPLMLCTFICCSFLWFVCGLVTPAKYLSSIILQSFVRVYSGAFWIQYYSFREVTNLNVSSSAYEFFFTCV